MFKKLSMILMICSSSMALAEIRPFLDGELGYVDTDFDSSPYVSGGGGIQFNDHVEFELGFNNYGEVGPFKLGVTSISYHLNIGAPISENARLFAIVGAERLDVDDNAAVGPFSIKVNESGTEALFGVGVGFNQDDQTEIRATLVSHDSSDLLTVGVGVAIYF